MEASPESPIVLTLPETPQDPIAPQTARTALLLITQQVVPTAQQTVLTVLLPIIQQTPPEVHPAPEAQLHHLPAKAP